MRLPPQRIVEKKLSSYLFFYALLSRYRIAILAPQRLLSFRSIVAG